MTIDEVILAALGADSRATKASNADRVAAFRRALAEAGMVVVPMEPTEKMIAAAEIHTLGSTGLILYRAMISASQG